MITIKEFLNNFSLLENSNKERNVNIDIYSLKNRILSYKSSFLLLESKKKENKDKSFKEEQKNLTLEFLSIEKELKRIPNIIEDLDLESFSYNNSEHLGSDSLPFSKLDLHRVVFFGKEAIVKRKLENILLINAKDNDYTILDLPVIVNEDATRNSGHFYFFKENIFSFSNMCLVPTSEVSILEYFKNKNLDKETKVCCLSSCFRKEGSYGKRDKYTRFYQFTKLELFSFCLPNNSKQFLEHMLLTASRLLQKLDINHRIVKNHPSDTSFHASITYDILGILSTGEEIEISSCSLIKDFQTKPNKTKIQKKICFSLNGTAFAVERLLLVLLDRYGSLEKLEEILNEYI